MSSNREKLKQANRVSLNQVDNRDNLTKEIKRNYDAHQISDGINLATKEQPVVSTVEEKAEVSTAKMPAVHELPPSPAPVNESVTQVSKGGRPKKYTQPLKKLTLYMPEEYHLFAKENGWKYDGINGFINHLIEEEMKRTK